MDELERYLDRVCRGVGGPRGLRQHVRRELREHLLDAAAEHRAAGLPAADALARALADFGGPDQVGAELEATHGHRSLGVTIDTALQWKERTMRAKWLWATWVNLGLLGVIGLNLLFLAFSSTMILPKLKKLTDDGWLGFDPAEPAVPWMYGYLGRLPHAMNWLFGWGAAVVLAVWGLFEWRVRGENKGAIRQAALGTVAVGLTAAAVIAGGSMVIPLMMGLPGSKIARPWAVESVTSLEAAVTAAEQSVPGKDWEVVRTHLRRADEAMDRLERGPGLTALARWNEPPTAGELWNSLRTARPRLTAAEQAAREKDADKFAAAVTAFRTAFAPVAAAAARPGP